MKCIECTGNWTTTTMLLYNNQFGHDKRNNTTGNEKVHMQTLWICKKSNFYSKKYLF